MNYNSEQYGFDLIKAKRRGPKSAAQTPAKPSERRRGSSKNKPGSAGIKSDKAIEFSKKVIELFCQEYFLFIIRLFVYIYLSWNTFVITRNPLDSIMRRFSLEDISTFRTCSM